MVSSPQHEPTMEEILASIRKIISEDSTEATPAAAPEPAPAPAPRPAAPAMAVEDDVLDLTQEIEEVPMPAPEPMRPSLPENDIVFEPNDPPVAHEAPAHSPEGIFSDKTRRALDDTFASIDEPEETHRAHASPGALPVDGLSVEAVFERAVRESFEPVVNQWLGGNADAIVERMKPLIREWMDEHFPALLEGAVRDEVARVARARGVKR
jgi:uncharacterized protein